MRSLQALLAAFACATLPLYAADLNDLTWTTADGEVTITDCDQAASGELVIPPAIEGNSVTNISTNTFRDCTNLTSITLPDSVTSIESRAFQGCTSLTSITLPDSVTSISTDTFYRCTSLTSITLPNTVTSIGFGAFEDCSSLTSITLSDSVTSIGSRAFRDCNTLQSVYFLGAPPTVGSTAFLNADAGAKAIVPAQFIEDFGGNGAVWNGLIVEECVALCWLTWTTTDGEVTISDCNQAASGELVIPDTIDGNPVTNIGENAFQDCESLTSVTIPDSVTSIGDEVFRNCSSLASVTISENVTGIPWALFRGCSGLTSVTIPENVTRIGGLAFFNCSSLTSVTIPENVTDIGQLAFAECSNLASVTIGESVTSIGGSAFQGCTGLTSITIPDSVTSIGGSVFWDCTNLTSVTIGESVTSIGGGAFQGCTHLTSITIPENVTDIGQLAFSGCSDLASVTFQGAAPTVGIDAFSGVADGAVAVVLRDFAKSFGGIGSTWEGLTVSRLDYTVEVATVTGSGSVGGGGTFTNGSSVTLTATPDAGYVFIGWSGDATGSANPLTLTIEGDMNIGAIFIEPAAHGLVTQASYDAVVAERDARFTEDQIRAMSADYTIGLNEAGNVQMKINLFESADLATFAPRTVNPESVSVVDGSICFEFVPTDDAAFFRFSVQ